MKGTKLKYNSERDFYFERFKNGFVSQSFPSSKIAYSASRNNQLRFALPEDMPTFVTMYTHKSKEQRKKYNKQVRRAVRKDRL